MDPDPGGHIRSSPAGRSGATSIQPGMQTMMSRDGLRMMVREWYPAVPVRGTVCLLHGHGEHGGQHQVLARPLAEAGFAVLAMDLRGHGLSEGKRGHTPSYGHYLDDLDALLERSALRFPETPRYVYGHSLGGNIALNHALRRPRTDIAGIVTTCPWLRLTHEISKLRVFLASLVRPLWPSFSVSTSVDLPKLIVGPVADSVDIHDPLCHDRITMETYLSVRKAGVWAVEHAHRLWVPTLALHGELDDVADQKATIAFGARSNGRCEVRILPGQYHNVQMEPGPMAYVRLIQEWLEARMAESHEP